MPRRSQLRSSYRITATPTRTGGACLRGRGQARARLTIGGWRCCREAGRSQRFGLIPNAGNKAASLCVTRRCRLGRRQVAADLAGLDARAVGEVLVDAGLGQRRRAQRVFLKPLSGLFSLRLTAALACAFIRSAKRESREGQECSGVAPCYSYVANDGGREGFGLRLLPIGGTQIGPLALGRLELATLISPALMLARG
jgi:hypothetical protein